jgi:aspartate/methionine/tyrosine aminotransferase
VKFPPFEHLHFYDDLHGPRFLNISYSDITPFTIQEFGGYLPTKLDLTWGEVAGMPSLRRRVAALHGVPRENVLITTGATEANFVVNAALVGPGERVIADSPMYSPLRDCPRGFGANVIEVPRDCRDGWAFDVDRFRKAANRRTRLLVVCNLNNPTSARIGKGELRELLDLAGEIDAHLLVDETFRDLAFSDPPPSVASLGPRGIAMSTVSKMYGLGMLKVGWIVARPEVLRRVLRVRDYTTGNAPPLAQAFADWAVKRHDFFVRRARTIVERNRALLQETLDRTPAFHADLPEIGNVVFPHSDVNVTKLERLLIRKYRTVIAHGRYFAARGFRDHFRLGLGGRTPIFRRGLANVRRAVAELT